MGRRTAVAVLLGCLALAGCLPAAPAARVARATPTAPAPAVKPTAAPPAPAEVPTGWEQYTAITQDFTLSYPPTWSAEDESWNHVSLAVPGDAGLSIGIYRAICGVDTGAGDGEVLDCLAARLAELSPQRGRFRLTGKGVWSDGHHRGYIVEDVVDGYLAGSPRCDVSVFIPLPDGWLISASYFHFGATRIDEREREILSAVVHSFRLRPHWPAEEPAAELLLR